MNELEKENKELLTTIEKLQRQVKALKSRKTYGLVWEEEKEPEQVVLDCQHKIPILKEVKIKDIDSRGILPTNFMIEGDNYHSLSVLNYTHKGKIDLIYIDPPYNTESKEFVYNDKYIDKEDTYRHSKWLNFMKARLSLARELLNATGAIFISINENEFCQLKLLCDAIFGPSNYMSTFTIKVRHEERILKGDKDFHEVVEYLLMYRKTQEYITTKRIRDNTSNQEYVYEIQELIKKPKHIELGSKKVFVFKPGQYKIIKGAPDEKKLKKINIRGSIKEGNSSGRFYMAHLEKKRKDIAYLYKVPNMGGDGLGYRYFLAPTSEKKSNGDYFQGVPQDRSDVKEIPYPNYFDFEEDFNNVGYEGEVDFRNGKKPINFIMKVFEMGGLINNKNAQIVDFFAGSGSTAEALLRLNAVDEGKRRFIICTNNEVEYKSDQELKKQGYKPGDKEYEAEGIAQKKCYPRLKNIINGYGDYKPLSFNLKYFKTVSLDIDHISHVSDEQKINLTHRAGEMIALREDTFEEVEKNEYWQVFKNRMKYTAIYFKEDKLKLNEFTKKLGNLKEPVVLYIFSWGKNEYKNEFTEYKNIKVEDIPEPIIDVYKEVNRLS
jgi:16S rRNA G966 N2-methylase RsmD